MKKTLALNHTKDQAILGNQWKLENIKIENKDDVYFKCMNKIIIEEYLKPFFEGRISGLRQKCNRSVNL